MKSWGSSIFISKNLFILQITWLLLFFQISYLDEISQLVMQMMGCIIGGLYILLKYKRGGVLSYSQFFYIRYQS